MFESALRADSPLLGFPNSQSQDPLHYPSPDYPRLLCDSNKRASIATNYSTSSFDSSLDHDYVQSLYHASTTTNSSICTPLTPLSPSIPEGELGSRWSLASSIEDEPKKKEKKPRKKISKDLLLADGEPKRKRLTSFISRLSLGAGNLLSPTNSISSLTSNGVHSPGGPNSCNEHQDITVSYPQSPTTPIDASAATRDRDWSHHASHPSVSSTSTSSSSSFSTNHEPPFGLGLGFALEPIDERERPSQTPPPPVPPKDSPTQYVFIKDQPPLPLVITTELEVLKSPRLVMSPTPTPSTPTLPQSSAHTSTPPGSPQIGVALASPLISPTSEAVDDVYVDDAYEIAAVDPGLVFKARRIHKGMSRVIDPNLSSDDNDDGDNEERPPTPPTPSSPMMFGRAPSPTPSELSVLSAIDTGLGVSANGVVVSGVEERRRRLKVQEMKRKEKQKWGAEDSMKSLRNEEGVVTPLPLEERSPNVDGVWRRTKSKMMGATPGKRKTSQPKAKLRLKSKTPSIDTTNTSFSTSTSTSTPETLSSELMSRSASRSTTKSPGDTESVLSFAQDVCISPSISRTPSSYQPSPASDQQVGYDFPTIESGPQSASSFSTWSAKMGKSMEKLNIYTKSDGKPLRTRRSTMTGIRGLALKMGIASAPPVPTPPSTTPSLRGSASVASFASMAQSSPVSASSGFGFGPGSNLAVSQGLGSGSNSVTALASVSVSTLGSPISLSPGTGGETLVSVADGKGPVLILPPPPTIPPPVPPKQSQQQLQQPPPPEQYYYPPLPLSASASAPPHHFHTSAYNKPLPPSKSPSPILHSPVAPILKKSTSTPMGLGTGLGSRPMYTRPTLRTTVSNTTAYFPPYASRSSSARPLGSNSPRGRTHVPSYMKSTWDLEESESDVELECDLGGVAERSWQQQSKKEEEEEGEEESELAYMGRRKRSGSATAHLDPSSRSRLAVPAIHSVAQTQVQAKYTPWAGTGNHGDSDSDVDPGVTRPARRRGYSLGRRRQSVLLAAAGV